MPESLPDNVRREHVYMDLPTPAPFAGSVRWMRDLGMEKLGANLCVIPPQSRSCPLHAHVFEEEVFFVREGTLTVRELDAGSTTWREYTLHAGELVVYAANTGIAHGFYNRTDAPVRTISLSENHWGEICTYPDSGKTMLRPFQKVGYFGDAPDVPDRDVVTLDDEDRPDYVVTVGHLTERDLGDVFGIQASRAGGAKALMVNYDRLVPGGETAPLHWHSADEELVFVLKGAPTLRQLRGRLDKKVPDFEGATEERVQLAPGDVVHFGPQRPLAHQLLNESDADCVLLVVGTDDPQDVCLFPERNRVFVKALGRAQEFRPAPYFEGEI